ncbi:MAG: Uma2 family endonuclease, partial [Waterburya sp.]
MAVTTYKWSIEEWHELVESGVLEGKPVELLEGEIIKMSPEREEHSYTNDDVAELLREKLKGLA